jgi:hypothetical protein
MHHYHYAATGDMVKFHAKYITSEYKQYVIEHKQGHLLSGFRSVLEEKVNSLTVYF